MMVEAWLVLVELIIVSTVSHAWGMHRGERRALRASARQPDEVRIGSSPYRELPPGAFSSYADQIVAAKEALVCECARGGQCSVARDFPPFPAPEPPRPGWTLDLPSQKPVGCPHGLGQADHLAVSARCDSKCLVTAGRWAPHVHARCHRCQTTWIEAVGEPAPEADRGGEG